MLLLFERRTRLGNYTRATQGVNLGSVLWLTIFILLAQNKPFRKQRSKSQISAVFRSVSIKISGNCVNPKVVMRLYENDKSQHLV